jgi:iron(III) transport system ATP-binding protein
VPGSYLTVDAVGKRFGATVALDSVTLGLAEGERLALLGPSGCGKTTLLRVVCGLEAPDTGSVAVAGETLVGPGVFVPPERRRVGMVFQDWALFPHRTVTRNVAYGLTRDEVASGRVEETLELVGLGGLGDRFPHQLSGGQAQRVAVARALAPRPRLLLFDEPFSNLDAELRLRVRADVAELMRRVGMTSVFVTHDREEAFVLGDRVAVMRDGALIQAGTPLEVYEEPATAWVAGFLGDVNLLEGHAAGSVATTAIGELELAHQTWGPCVVAVRPEHLVLDAGWDATVASIEFYGHDTSYALTLGGTRLLARVMAGPRFAPGDQVAVSYTGPSVVAYTDAHARSEPAPVAAG